MESRSHVRSQSAKLHSSEFDLDGFLVNHEDWSVESPLARLSLDVAASHSVGDSFAVLSGPTRINWDPPGPDYRGAPGAGVSPRDCR